jgi:hypothetical protein
MPEYMLPGQYLVVLDNHHSKALELRYEGLQLRDTILILSPGPKLQVAFLFRMSPEGTIAENITTHGCGGLNIDGCRIPTEEQITTHSRGDNVGTYRLYR